MRGLAPALPGVDMDDFDEPGCPLSEEEEDWVDQVAEWVLEVFGADYLLAKPQVLPST